jgi:N utilization substance protein A
MSRSEIASIEGFDEETPAKSRSAPANISTPSRPSTTPSAGRSASPTKLYEIPGVTAAMLVALGKERHQDVEDFAGCAADDLVGWTPRPRR